MLTQPTLNVLIIGNGASGIIAAHKLIQHCVSTHQALDLTFVDPNTFGGNTYNREDVSVGMANPVSH